MATVVQNCNQTSLLIVHWRSDDSTRNQDLTGSVFYNQQRYQHGFINLDFCQFLTFQEIKNMFLLFQLIIKLSILLCALFSSCPSTAKPNINFNFSGRWWGCMHFYLQIKNQLYNKLTLRYTGGGHYDHPLAKTAPIHY